MAFTQLELAFIGIIVVVILYCIYIKQNTNVKTIRKVKKTSNMLMLVAILALAGFIMYKTKTVSFKFFTTEKTGKDNCTIGVVPDKRDFNV